MHPLQLIRAVAILLLIISLFMLLPVVVALAYGETPLIRAFLLPMGLIWAAALPLLILTRGAGAQLGTRDGFLLVTLGWASVALVSCLPFTLSGAIPSFTDAFFETMSGYTTTGASILTNIQSLPRAILFWRSLTHWLGGMGIVVLTVAVFPLLGIGAYQLMKAEAPGPTLDKITPRIAQTAKLLWSIYMGLTAAETLLLLAGGMDLFDALTHTFGTLATGGFSPRNKSVGAFPSPYVHVVITVFMLMAGLNFALYYRLLTGRIRQVLSNVEARAYLLIFVVAAVATSLVLRGRVYQSFGTSLRYASFQVASILTTTGYVTTDYAAWPAAAQGVLFLLMFVGGSAGSTGGGIKVIRVVTLLKQGLTEMKVLTHPRAIFSLKLGRDAVKKDMLYTISGFFFLYMLMLLATTLVVAASGSDLLTSLASALATLGNIGPGFGLVGPALNYAFFPHAVKWFLSFAMLVGRLEVYTVLILLTPAFWRG